jgi:hypothetical protein
LRLFMASCVMAGVVGLGCYTGYRWDNNDPPCPPVYPSATSLHGRPTPPLVGTVALSSAPLPLPLPHPPSSPSSSRRRRRRLSPLVAALRACDCASPQPCPCQRAPSGPLSAAALNLPALCLCRCRCLCPPPPSAPLEVAPLCPTDELHECSFQEPSWFETKEFLAQPLARDPGRPSPHRQQPPDVAVPPGLQLEQRFAPHESTEQPGPPALVHIRPRRRPAARPAAATRPSHQPAAPHQHPSSRLPPAAAAHGLPPTAGPAWLSRCPSTRSLQVPPPTARLLPTTAPRPWLRSLARAAQRPS